MPDNLPVESRTLADLSASRHISAQLSIEIDMPVFHARNISKLLTFVKAGLGVAFTPPMM